MTENGKTYWVHKSEERTWCKLLPQQWSLHVEPSFLARYIYTGYVAIRNEKVIQNIGADDVTECQQLVEQKAKEYLTALLSAL